MEVRMNKINSKKSKQFTAFFGGNGVKNSFMRHLQPVILLVNLRDSNNQMIAPYAWINRTPSFEKLNLQSGDKVSFDATTVPVHEVHGHYRHYVEVPHILNYKLNRPMNIEVIARSPSDSKTENFLASDNYNFNIEGRKNETD